MEIRIHNYPRELRGEVNFWLELINKILESTDLDVRSFDVIFTDDATLKQMHKTYLNDPTETDVITFNLGEDGVVEAEIYISIDRAKAQARQYDVSSEEEVLRLIIHGVLHLQGYDDLEDEARKEMKVQENALVERFRDQLAE